MRILLWAEKYESRFFLISAGGVLIMTWWFGL